MNDQYNKYNELKHDCELQLQDDILYNYIKSGIFVELRRKFRKICLISEMHPDSKLHFRSMYAIRVEQRKHLRNHYFLIHPLSRLNLVRERLMIFIYTFIYILAPFYVMLTDEPELVPVRCVLDYLCMIDAMMNINTGYIIKLSNKVVMRRLKIFRHKFLPIILFDVLSSIHYSDLGFDDFFDNKFKFDFLVGLKYFRFMTLLYYLDQFFEQTRVSFKTVTILKLILLAFILSIWSTLSIAISNQLSGYERANLMSDANYILLCYQQALFILLLYGSESAVDYYHAILEIILFTVGVAFQLIVISQLVQIFRFSGSRNAFYRISQQLEQFMHFRNLPDALRKRLRTYFHFRFQEDCYKEAAILEMISPQLHQEMLLHTHMYLLDKSSIFFDLPIVLKSRIIQCLIPEIFLASDVIITAGTLGECMYFLASGTVAVYTPAGKELCHLSDGASFGELSMVIENEPRIANVVAIDNCEVFLFHRKDFLREMRGYPEIYDRIRLLVQDKVRHTLMGSLDVDASSEQFSTHSIRSKQYSYGYIRI